MAYLDGDDFGCSIVFDWWVCFERVWNNCSLEEELTREFSGVRNM